MMDKKIGTVDAEEKRIIVVNIDAYIGASEHFDVDTEFHVKVNGRSFKRLNLWQAKKIGLVTQ